MKLKELKKIGAELEVIVQPQDDDDKLISLTKGKQPAIEKKIKEAAEMLDEKEGDKDKCSNELIAGLAELGIKLPWDSEESEDGGDGGDDGGDDGGNVPNFDEMSLKELKAFAKENDISLKDKMKFTRPKMATYIEVEWVALSHNHNNADLTWEDLEDMNRKKLEELVDEKELVTDPDDYEEIEDFRVDVAVELEIDVPDDTDPDNDEDSTDDTEPDPKEEEEKDERSVETILAGTSKLVDLKELVNQYKEFKKLRKKLDDFSGLQGPRQLKPLMYKALGIDLPKNAPKRTKSTKNKDPKKVKYNRVTSVSDCITKMGKKGFTLEELRNASGALYAKKTGNPDCDPNAKMHPATHIVNYMVIGLVTFAVLEKTDKIYTFI